MMQFIVHILKRFSLALAFYLPLGFSLQIPCSAQTYFNKQLCFLDPVQQEAAHSILAADSGYMIIGATAYSGNEDLLRIAISRLNQEGDLVQTVYIGDTIRAFYSGVGVLLNTLDNAFAFAGTIYKGGDTADNQAAIFKFNDGLQLTWVKLYGNKDGLLDTINAGRGLYQTQSGDYLLTGEQYSGGDYNEFYLQKTDAEGNQLWRKTYWFGGLGSSLNVIATTDGGYAMGGYRYYPGPNVEVDPLVVKTDSLGNLEWYADIGSEYDDAKACVALAQDGNILAATIKADSLDLNKLEYKRLHIRSFSNSGTELWSKSYGKSYYFRNISKLRVAQNGNFVVVGTVPDVYPHIVGWIWLFTPDGDSLWYREYELLGGAESMNYLYDVNEAPDGGFAACGVLYPFVPDTGNMDAWVLKVDSLGCEAPGECWVGINVTAPPQPLTVAGGELSIRPNPATTETHITWQGEAKLLEVFNASGVRVWQCKLPPEQTQYRLNTQAWPHGLYLLRLFMQDGQAITTKMMKQ